MREDLVPELELVPRLLAFGPAAQWFLDNPDPRFTSERRDARSVFVVAADSRLAPEEMVVDLLGAALRVARRHPEAACALECTVPGASALLSAMGAPPLPSTREPAAGLTLDLRSTWLLMQAGLPMDIDAELHMSPACLAALTAWLTRRAMALRYEETRSHVADLSLEGEPECSHSSLH